MGIKNSIQWATKSWNPVTGRCPHKCPYCYMWGKGGIASRFKDVHDHPLRLNDGTNGTTNVLKAIPKRGRIFVGSSTDMFCDGVPDKWLWAVLHRLAYWAEDYDWDWDYDPYEWVKYFMLTKNPKRYMTAGSAIDQFCEDHLWYGTTWDGTEKTRNNVLTLGELSLYGYNTFVSFEPLLADPEKYNVTLDYSEIKWIIIGGDSRKGQHKPPKAWADYLIGDARRNSAKVFIKDNYGYPEEIKEQI